MDRTLTPSGRLPERVYNEFSTNVSLSSPDGLIRSSDVDRYIENALKPLIEEGKILKRISLDRRAAVRTVTYAYQGNGKKIQDSINAVLNNMHDALGYDVDPTTGNVKGTNAPPPMSITGLKQARYNVIKERILDPRAAASIRADALRAGGASTTDKASGYTTTIVPSGQSGQAKAMQQLVDDTDKKYLAGELPSSALADGSSPATVEERAKARVARRANTMDAEITAIENHVKQYPDSAFSRNYLAKMQNVSNREEKQRLLEAMRTPGTFEFKAAAERRLNRRVANDDAIMEWAKKNKRSPLAKVLKRSITRRRRSATAGGRLLNKLTAAPWQLGVVAGVVGIIALAAKIFSSLMRIGDTVHDIKMKNATYNVTSGDAAAMVQKARYMRLPDQVFSGALGTLSSMLAGPRSVEGLNKILTALAPMSMHIGGRTVDESVQLYLHKKDNPVALLKTILSESFAAYTEGIDELGRPVGEHAARRSLVENLRNNVSPEIAQILEVMIAGYHDADSGIKGLVSTDVVEGSSWYDAVLNHIFRQERAEKITDIFSQNERNEADRIHGIFRDIADSISGIWDSLMGKLLANLEPIALFGRGLLRWLIGLPGVRDIPGMAEVAVASDKEAHTKNEALQRQNAVLLDIQEKSLNRMSSAVGISVESLPTMISYFEDMGKLPTPFAEKGLEKGLHEFLPLLTLYKGIERKRRKEVEFAEQAANFASGAMVREVGGASLGAEELAAKADIHHAMSNFTHNMRIIDMAETDEEWDRLLTNIKQRHIGNVRTLLEEWDKSDEDIWRIITNPANDSERVYYNRYRMSGDTLDAELNLLGYADELIQIDRGMPGALAAPRYRNAHSLAGSESYGISQRMVLELEKNGLLSWLEDPQTYIKIEGERGVMDIKVTLERPDHAPEAVYIDNASNANIHREGFNIGINWDSVYEGGGIMK